MPFKAEDLLNIDIPVVEQTFTVKDTMFYALSVGLAYSPLDPAMLEFVYEKTLKALPTMGVVLAHPGNWMVSMNTGIDYLKVVHGEQGLIVHKSLPTEGAVVGKTRVIGVADKGEGRGALIFVERDIADKATGEKLVTVTDTTFARGDGGCGSAGSAGPKPHAIPERNPDIVCDLPTMNQMGLIYRLNADYNPLHADPGVAERAGFEKPILHGLATYGVAGHAVLKEACGYDPARLRTLSGRFTAPVYPGETFRTEIWIDVDVASFRTKSIERDVVAINNGRADIRR
ncbi:MaoC family dehydratase [Bradyrhizobium sp. 169]|uniref:MaoC family dehydratase n=1 Tax=Bradyrhizobium sp. 169 TaxID=2782640 RepID=UPI001FF746FE|nr:MaoC family dehydratase [Bradyrhizobium sp. 169]MCK1592257.1 MaoC family dehydratase N-terminal domain-containing protein [Bradyrhizobium sp. 169]